MSLTDDFRHCCFKRFAQQLASAHTPRHSLGEIAALLNPDDILYQLASGVDDACSRYPHLIMEDSDSALEQFLLATQVEAKQILPIYDKLVADIRRIDDATLLRPGWLMHPLAPAAL